MKDQLSMTNGRRRKVSARFFDGKDGASNSREKRGFGPFCFHHFSHCGLERQSVVVRIGRYSASENEFSGDRELSAGIGKMEAVNGCQEMISGLIVWCMGSGVWCLGVWWPTATL